MKKLLDFVKQPLFILISVLALAAWAGALVAAREDVNYKVKHHICVDLTHRTCDGKCECDGMECPPWTPNNALQLIDGRDYQLDLIEDTILVWDGNRFVGKLPMWDNSPLDSLLVKDNE